MKNNSSNQSGNRKTLKLPDAVIIFLIPVLAYVLAFRYEHGYCTVFRIPIYLIKLDINNLLGYVTFLYILVMPVYFFLDAMIESRQKDDRLQWDFLIDTVWILFLLMTVYSFNLLTIPTGLIIISLTVMLYAYLKYIRPIFTQKDIKGYKNKLKQRKPIIIVEDSLMDLAIKKFGLARFMLVTILILMIGILGTIGAFVAKTQTSFMILKSNPELVVLRKYSNSLICAEFDREKKECKEEFYIKILEEISAQGVKILTERIGPLTVIEKKEKLK